MKTASCENRVLENRLLEELFPTPRDLLESRATASPTPNTASYPPLSNLLINRAGSRSLPPAGIRAAVPETRRGRELSGRAADSASNWG